MKQLLLIIMLACAALLSACASTSSPRTSQGALDGPPSLVISGGEIHKAYSRADLEAFSPTQAVFNDVPYKGVRLTVLLQEAGFDLAQVKAVKAVASDGYTVNYDPAQVFIDTVIVAYARVDGELADEDGSFRMVIPGAEGKLNVRMLVELQVYP